MQNGSKAKAGKNSVFGTGSTAATITRLARNAAREIAFQTSTASG